MHEGDSFGDEEDPADKKKKRRVRRKGKKGNKAQKHVQSIYQTGTIDDGNDL